MKLYSPWGGGLIYSRKFQLMDHATVGYTGQIGTQKYVVFVYFFLSRFKTERKKSH